MTGQVNGSGQALEALGSSRLQKDKKPDKALGQDAFLELMMAQLKNQDPTSPMQSGEFISQMAQFGTVSGIGELQKSFASLATSLQSNQALQASTMVGRQVEVEGNKLQLGVSGGAPFAFELPAAAGGVRLDILDSAGQTVRTLQLGPTAKGSHDVAWDGLGTQGQRLPAGVYTVKAAAQVGGGLQAATTLVRASVESVSLPRNGQPPVLNVAGHGPLNLEAIRRVM
jgi:flagellar basal-body rod modification protein FlgD